MYSTITGFILAFVLCLALTPLVRSTARRAGAVDVPGERRINRESIPRLGGVALFLAFLLPLVALFYLETSAASIFFSNPLRIVGLAVGGLMVCALGAVDDVRGVRASHKLAVQVAAAAVAYACSYRIEAVDIPFVGVLDMGAFALPVTILWIVAVVNALNLIDGLDGLAAGVALFAAIANLVVGYLTDSGLVMLTSATLAGSILGFLRYNFNPASIFMGDSGSMFLGYVLATSSLLGAAVKSSTTVAILVPVLAMGLPITDMLLAVVRRYLERRPIFSADRQHLHHRLLDLGITHRRAVLVLYSISLLGCLSAIGFAAGRSLEAAGALVVLSVLMVGLLRYFDRVRRTTPQLERQFASTTSRLRKAVPDALNQICLASTMDQVREGLENLASSVQMRECHLAAPSLDPRFQVAWSERASESPGRRDTFAVRAEYPLRQLSSGLLRFTMECTETFVLPQDEILLQLIADAVDERISSLARTREPVTAHGSFDFDPSPSPPVRL